MKITPPVRRFVLPGFILALALIAGGYLLTQKLRERERAQATLERFNRAADKWDSNLPWQTNLQFAQERLRAIGDEAVGPLIADLNFDPVHIRWLRKIPYLQQLKQLEDTSGTRLMAAGYLGILGHSATPAIEPLIDHLADSNPGVRLESARALGRISGNHSHTRSALTALLGGSDTSLAYAAAVALWQMNPGDEGSRKRVEGFIGTAPIEESSHLLLDLGPAGQVFAGALKQRLEGLPVDADRLHADQILWQWTGDKQPLLRDLDVLAKALPGSLANSGGTLSDAAGIILRSAAILDGDSSIRDQLKPLLQSISERAGSGMQAAAANQLKHLVLVDQHEAESTRNAQKQGHP